MCNSDGVCRLSCVHILEAAMFDLLYVLQYFTPVLELILFRTLRGMLRKYHNLNLRNGM